jgi:KH domain
MTIEIPHAQHATLQGPKGQLLRAVRDECGGVMIRFPAANVQSDKVLLRGPPEDVEKAKSLLMDLANEKVKYSNCCFIPRVAGRLLKPSGFHILTTTVSYV